MELDKNISILLAEDDEFYRTTMRTMLNSLGFENIVEAENGQQALHIGQETRPRFALIDIYMPGMNGWEVVDFFRKKLPETILIMVTGSRDIADIDAAFAHGVDGYFLKPCNREDVLETLTRLAELREKKKH